MEGRGCRDTELLGWLLRPFIGIPAEPTRFLRKDGWSNAYVFIADRSWEVLTR